MEPLLLPVPPMIEEAFGYAGSFRFVGFYYDAGSRTLCWSDPRGSGFSASGIIWRAFTRHPRVSPFFERLNFGDDALAADRWLLLDRVKREFYAGAPSEVLSFLSSVRHEIWSAEYDALPQAAGPGENSPWLRVALTEIMNDWLDQA